MSLITNGSIASTIAVAVFSILKFDNSKIIKWVAFYCLIDAVIEIIAQILVRIGEPNIFLFYILIWLEVFMLMKYFHATSKSVARLSFIKMSIIIYSILAIILLYFESIKSLHPYSGTFQSLFIFFLGLLSFNDELKIPKHSDIIKEPYFWFTSSFVIFYGCNSFILIGANVTFENKESFNSIWLYQNLLTIIKNILIFVGILLSKK
ncbi:MAG: hypothetical protein IT267_07200 [Saprospiraceae bacterium]|nr:hypothetical protein [Saprospiraceae bacterium]